ncbi:DMT family transporter [Chryseobacterium indologenes]|uniref:DMT family transporter n=1 Tax=Chryseobacterium indologenes TaxID=253 RepID=UPI000F4FEB18|nr:DMT family transporter [Chryseobacterium indologenes]AYZ35092.1 DMT family transporter [Chryseobacterium indologenes]MBF6643841.1 DMT family transporter [Chryseobacterium indologenes]MEB4762819.1 DMT family transporter [Chryseobacterium indologenes]QQQ72429.1 DMT family transporter [Chryseobacterium indologenes]
MQKKNIYYILLIIGTAFWGISFPVTKNAITSSKPALFLSYRFLMATVALAISFSKYLKLINLNTLKASSKLAIPLMLGIVFQTLGLKYIEASQCTFIAGLGVVVVPVMKWIFYKIRIPSKIWATSLIALTGLCIIALTNDLKINKGSMYTMLGTLGFSLYLIQVERENKNIDIAGTIIPMFAICSLLSFCYTGTEVIKNWFPTDRNFWFSVIFCALFSTTYMYTVSMLAQKYINAEKVAIIYLFEPIFGTIASYFILDELITIRLLLGGAFIMLATFYSEITLIKNSVRAKDFSEFN